MSIYAEVNEHEKEHKIPNWLITKTNKCQRCNLSLTRRKTVIGRGSTPADILLMGEGPGDFEDMQGEAFVGPSGKLLDSMINRTGYAKDLSFFFTNVVLCHPTDVVGGENREPMKQEIEACRSYIVKLIELCDPYAVVFVGTLAAKKYLRFFQQNLPEVRTASIIHPAVLLRAGKGTPKADHDIKIMSELFNDVARDKWEV